MADMPRPRPPFLHCERSRHGKAVWYVRRGKGPRIRLWAAWGTPEFEVEYRAAVAGETIQRALTSLGITHARDGGSVNDGRHVLTRGGETLGRYDAFEAWGLVRREKAALANKEGA